MKNPKINPGETEESIADLTWMLSMLENAEQLAELQAVPELTPSSLKRAAKRLEFSQYQRIKAWGVCQLVYSKVNHESF